MSYWLRRHPLLVTAFFRHTLVLTYALPAERLQPLLPPGLSVDTYGRLGFIAIAMVQTEALRPAGLPARLGRNFFLSGYRVFARYGRLRGLRILRSDTDSRLMVFAGNLLTHYNYRRAAVRVEETGDTLRINVGTGLSVEADLASRPASLPPGSPFRDLREARRFAGPLPFTFDYEPETHSLVIIEAAREQWEPEPVRVVVYRNEFFAGPQWQGVEPVLANAFYVGGVSYRWKRGVVHALPKEVAT